MKKFLFVAVLAWAVYMAVMFAGDPRGWFTPDQTSEDNAVVLYATEWCGYCRAARRFLQENNIRYVEHDIEKSPDAHRRYRELGGSGVPLLEVNGEVIRGFNPNAIKAALR